MIDVFEYPHVLVIEIKKKFVGVVRMIEIFDEITGAL
jgi:hypothetical protein